MIQSPSTRIVVRSSLVLLLLAALAIAVLHPTGKTAILKSTSDFSNQDLALRAPRLVVGSVVSVKSVATLSMLSTRDGYGVAVVPVGENSYGRTYLVRTHDGARTWRVAGNLPVRTDEVQFSNAVRAVTAHLLYYLDGRDHATYISTNAGRSWRWLVAPGQSSSFLLVGDDVWVTSDRCTADATTGGNFDCWSYLFVFPRGAATPIRRVRIPYSHSVGVGSPGYLPGHSMYASLSAAVGAHGALVLASGGQIGGRSVMLEANRDGRHWRVLREPCRAASPFATFTLSVTHWVQFCAAPGGMMQGTNELFSSLDAGATWTTLAARNEDGSLRVGHFNDVMSSGVAVSSTGRDMWQTTLAGRTAESADGGVTWRWVPSPHVNVSGSQGVDAVGDASAFVAVHGSGVWRTLDGVHWVLLT